jgi:hypothetical protein
VAIGTILSSAAFADDEARHDAPIKTVAKQALAARNSLFM